MARLSKNKWWTADGVLARFSPVNQAWLVTSYDPAWSSEVLHRAPVLAAIPDSEFQAVAAGRMSLDLYLPNRKGSSPSKRSRPAPATPNPRLEGGVPGLKWVYFKARLGDERGGRGYRATGGGHDWEIVPSGYHPISGYSRRESKTWWRVLMDGVGGQSFDTLRRAKKWVESVAFRYPRLAGAPATPNPRLSVENRGGRSVKLRKGTIVFHGTPRPHKGKIRGPAWFTSHLKSAQHYSRPPRSWTVADRLGAEATMGDVLAYKVKADANLMYLRAERGDTVSDTLHTLLVERTKILTEDEWDYLFDEWDLNLSLNWAVAKWDPNVFRSPGYNQYGEGEGSALADKLERLGITSANGAIMAACKADPSFQGWIFRLEGDGGHPDPWELMLCEPLKHLAREMVGAAHLPNRKGSSPGEGGLFDDAFGSQEELGRGVGADVKQKLGMSEMLDASRLLKSTKGLSEPAVFWFRGRDAWMVKTTAADERAALKIGKAVQRSLVSKRRLKSVDPYLHQAELYAAFDGGHVVLPGLADLKRSAGPSSAGIIKQKVLFKAKEFFGARGAKLSGKAGAYRLWLAPARAELKGLFAPGTLTAATLQELDHKLDLTILEVS